MYGLAFPAPPQMAPVSAERVHVHAGPAKPPLQTHPESPNAHCGATDARRTVSSWGQHVPWPLHGSCVTRRSAPTYPPGSVTRGFGHVQLRPLQAGSHRHRAAVIFGGTR
jgi:hypothetical protein